jgi:AcrR family transcriptional regulator
MPRSNSFTKQEIGAAALDAVRAGGWDTLTVRSIAACLGVSVAPVYGAFDSKDELLGWILQEIARRLEAYCAKSWSSSSFLNIGVGFVAFARDEPNLFLALYRGGRSGGIVEGLQRELRGRMPEDEFLASLDTQTLDRIFRWLWTFAFGMAVAILFGHEKVSGDEEIIRAMRSAGSIVMYGVLSGLEDYEGTAAAEAWNRLLVEKGIRAPGGEKNER